MHGMNKQVLTAESAHLDPKGSEAVVALLKGIIARQEFQVVFQPIQGLQSGQILGMEALCRFEGEPYRPPNIWFADAERVGFGVELEMAVFEKALEALGKLPEHVYLSLNASPAAIVSGRVREALANANCERVVLELTEHTVCANKTSLFEQLALIRLEGVRLALDDLGAGFSGLQQLVDLNPDVLKLDISLISSIDTNSSPPIPRVRDGRFRSGHQSSSRWRGG